MTIKLALPFDTHPEAQARADQLSADLGYPRVPKNKCRHGTGKFAGNAAAATMAGVAVIPKAYTGVWGVVVAGDEVDDCAERYSTVPPFSLLTPEEQTACVPVDASWYPDAPATPDVPAAPSAKPSTKPK